MDHLPQLQDCANGRIHLQVPFLEDSRYVYDGQGLEGFEARRNFKFVLPNDSLDALRDRDSSAFFQSWLFFGILTEVFQVYDIPVVRDDFVGHTQDGPIVTTKLLPDYIGAWIVRASREYPGCLDRDKHYSTAREVASKIGPVAGQVAVSLIRAVRRDNTPAPTAMEVLRQKRQLWQEGRDRAKAQAARIHRLLKTAYEILHGFGRRANRIEDAVWDSALVLCTTLQTAAFFMYRTCPLDAPFTVPFNNLQSPLRTWLFAKNGWCPREQKIIADLVEGDQCALLLCAQLDRRQDSQSHTRCNAGRCEAYQVNADSYRTSHDQGCSGCDLLGFEGFDSNEPVRSRLLDAVTMEKSWLSVSRPIPMAMYCEGQLRLVLVSAQQLLGDRFVAISHVWADGLGNTTANALPQCQLARIQNLVDKQFPDKKGPFPFWMDTLCIPVSKNKSDRFRVAKEQAIDCMEAVYKSATKVLVLDRSLTRVSSQDMSPEEIGIRIMCSGWARRLWTLQEGLFQAQVVYQFKDITHTYKDLRETVRRMHAFPGRDTSIPAKHFLHEILADPPNCAISSIDPLACFAHKALSCCWTRISAFFKELDIRYSQPDPAWFPGMQLVPNMTVLVPRALRTIAYRTTSVPQDEGRILSSLTNWRSRSAGTNPQSKDRMRACFEQFAIVPSQLIFLDQKRYNDLGARWIPQSLLAQSSDGTAPLPYQHAIFSDEFSWTSPMGITADYPSFRLTFPLRWSPSKNDQTFRLDLAGHSYTGFVHDAGSRSAPAFLPTKLTLIVPRSISSGPWICTAVLVSIQDRSPVGQHTPGSGFLAGVLARGRNALASHSDKSRVMGRHEALVDLKRVGKEQEGLFPRVEAVLMTEHMTADGNTRWRIS